MLGPSNGRQRTGVVALLVKESFAAAQNLHSSHVDVVDVALLLVIVYPSGYNMNMIEVRQTDVYARWFAKLRDRQAHARIDVRIRRLTLGNPGDVRPVGEGALKTRTSRRHWNWHSTYERYV